MQSLVIFRPWEVGFPRKKKERKKNMQEYKRVLAADAAQPLIREMWENLRVSIFILFVLHNAFQQIVFEDIYTFNTC